MTLLDEITAKCSPELIASGNTVAIAAAVSAGRTKPVKTAIGAGTIMAVLGAGATGGGALLAKMRANNLPAALADYADDIREALYIIDRGDLDVSSPATQGMIGAMVAAGMMTQAQADGLLALGVDTDPVTSADVIRALAGG